MLNDAIRYHEGNLHIDSIPLLTIAAEVGTPTYVYSLPRALANLDRIRQAFAPLNPEIHYSAKANANLRVLQTLIQAGAGIDAVSGGEIYRALQAGAMPEHIVFAGVGKTPEEIRYALEQQIGWFNVENAAELDTLQQHAEILGVNGVRVALRLNPEVTANTHPYIATGHGGAKFGLAAASVHDLLRRQGNYPRLHFAGVHVHIGSQLHDVKGTRSAIEHTLAVIADFPDIRTVNIGGGLPVAYTADDAMPPLPHFAEALAPLLQAYKVLMEPGRSIIADAGLLLTRVLYVKQQAGQTLVITDASMAELIRPALYQATHSIVPVQDAPHTTTVQVVGPVCETADVLGREVSMPRLQPGHLLAVLTAGAYGMVMASNYNARPRPPEIVIEADGTQWTVARRRETWADLIRAEELKP